MVQQRCAWSAGSLVRFPMKTWKRDALKVERKKGSTDVFPSQTLDGDFQKVTYSPLFFSLSFLQRMWEWTRVFVFLAAVVCSLAWILFNFLGFRLFHAILRQKAAAEHQPQGEENKRLLWEMQSHRMLYEADDEERCFYAFMEHYGRQHITFPSSR